MPTEVICIYCGLHLIFSQRRQDVYSRDCPYCHHPISNDVNPSFYHDPTTGASERFSGNYSPALKSVAAPVLQDSERLDLLLKTPEIRALIGEYFASYLVISSEDADAMTPMQRARAWLDAALRNGALRES